MSTYKIKKTFFIIACAAALFTSPIFSLSFVDYDKVENKLDNSLEHQEVESEDQERQLEDQKLEDQNLQYKQQQENRIDERQKDRWQVETPEPLDS